MVYQDWERQPASAQQHTTGVEREELLKSCEEALQRGNLCVTGPAGIGKTTVLDELNASAIRRGDVTLRASGAPGTTPNPGYLLHQFRRRLPATVIDNVTEEELAALKSPEGYSTADLAEAWTKAFELCAAGGNLTILVDNASDLDVESVQLLTSVFRQVDLKRLRVIIAACRVSPAVARLAPQPVTHLVVPPLTTDAVASIIEQLGLPAKFAGPLHSDSAGNPSLLLALAGALSQQRASALTPELMSPMMTAIIHERLDGINADIVAALQLCALSTQPTITLLQRCGRTNAADEISTAVDVGLVTFDDDVILFTPSSAATVIQAGMTGAERVSLHQRLAEAVPTREERLRHLALAAPEPNSEFAHELALNAKSARERGYLRLAGELYVLAADRASSEMSDLRSEWLVNAANLAASVGDDSGTHLASERALAESSIAAHRVQARLAEVRLAGHSTQSMMQELTTAEQDANSDPESMTSVLLWQAWVGLLAGDLTLSVERGEEAAHLAAENDDLMSSGFGWAISANAARAAGYTDYVERIERALATEKDVIFEQLHLSPSYVRARFNILDDELDIAGETLARLRATADRGGPVERVAVRRSALEVDLQLGRCRHALEHAQTVTNLAARNGLSPGPSWYTAAMAELASGSSKRAMAYAHQGVRASQHDKDMLFLRNNLYALGTAYMRRGQVNEAIDAFEQIRRNDKAHGVKDPTNVRYHSSLAEAYVALENYEAAQSVISEARGQLDAFPQSRSVPAMLQRSQALLDAATGDFDSAMTALDEAAATFEDLGLLIEQGRTYLAHAQTARARRRYAAARGVLNQAENLFQSAGAWAWIEQCHAFRTHLEGQSAEKIAAASSGSPAAKLSEAELRIARLVAEGATNREIAQKLYLSVKTVEATLTRVYRKMGVRSRTQLSAKLGH